jgi:nucleoside-diphosphate-sugar epimerase
LDKILLIGASGFIGKTLFNTIKKNEYQVFGFGKEVIIHKHRDYKIDLFQPRSYIDLIERLKPNVVISTVWNTKLNFWDSNMNEKYYKAHIQLFKICYDSGVRNIIGLGSAAEYGTNNLDCNASKSQVSAASDYGYYKYMTGNQLQNIAKSYQKNFIWLRIFQVYGKGERSHNLITTTIQNLRDSKNIQINNPNKILDWIHVEDVAEAIMLLINKKEAKGIFDIGSTVGTSVKTIVELIKKKVANNRAEIIFEKRYSEPEGLVCSKEIELFKLNWKPRIDLESGITKMLSS